MSDIKIIFFDKGLHYVIQIWPNSQKLGKSAIDCCIITPTFRLYCLLHGVKKLAKNWHKI